MVMTYFVTNSGPVRARYVNSLVVVRHNPARLDLGQRPLNMDETLVDAVVVLSGGVIELWLRLCRDQRADQLLQTLYSCIDLLLRICSQSRNAIAISCLRCEDTISLSRNTIAARYIAVAFEPYVTH